MQGKVPDQSVFIEGHAGGCMDNACGGSGLNQKDWLGGSGQDHSFDNRNGEKEK